MTREQMKRLFDIICSLFGLLIFAPLMAVVAIVIKLTSKGPVIYSQARSGPHRKAFHVYKFRAMVDKAETLGTQYYGYSSCSI